MSLTVDDKQAALNFVKDFAVNWPQGFGAHSDLLYRLGVTDSLAPRAMSVKATLFLVGPDRRILWCDGQMRHRHRSPAETRTALEEAIESALANDSSA